MTDSQMNDPVAWSWLDVLLDTRTVLASWRGGSAPRHPRAGAAMLLDGRLFDYQVARHEGSGLPPLTARESSADRDTAVLLALIHQIRGDRIEAVSRYRAVLAEDDSPDRLVGAAVLGSLTLWEGDRFAEARQLLAETLDRLPAAQDGIGPDTALLELHLGWRAAAHGSWDVAVAATTRAMTIAATTRLSRVLRSVGRANLRTFSLYADVPDQQRAAGDDAPPGEGHRLGKYTDALETFLDEEVRRRFAHPFSHGWRMRNEDPAERALWSATLQADCSASYGGSRASRAVLGRYRALEARAGGTVPDAEMFQLLLEGGTSDQLSQVAGWWLRQGPLDGLHEMVNRAATRDWLPVDEHATLALLTAAGDLLDEVGADAATSRICGALNDEDPPGRSFSYATYALPALTQALPGASDARQVEAASALLHLVERGGESITTPVWEPVQALRWTAATEAQRSRARSFVEEHLSGRGSPAIHAGALFFALASLDPEWARAVVDRHLGEPPGLLQVAVALDALSDPPDDVAQRGLEVSRAAVKAERQRAAEGKHSFGGVQPVRVLLALLLKRSDAEAWGELAAYLADPAVETRRKTHPTNVLANRAASLDGAARGALRAMVAQPPSGWHVYAHEPDEEPLIGPWLRLRLALELVDEDSATRELVGLTTHRRARQRAEAAWTALRVWDVAPSFAATVTVLLARDADAQVRAAAGTTLVRLVGSASSPTQGGHPSESDIVQALADLLAEPGTAAPLSILESLTESPVPVDVRTRLAAGVNGLVDSPSWATRQSASSVLAMWS